MKNPNTIKIHKMLKEIYNMTQGRLTQKSASLETPQEKFQPNQILLVGCHKNQGQNSTEKPDKNEENSSCYERTKIIGST